MLILLAIGFLAGVVTALSPCVLPVLPIVLAGGASGRKPLRIIAGLVGSFTVFTLGAAWLLRLPGLPQDLPRNVAIGLLFLLAATLLVPQIRDPAARPLQPSRSAATAICRRSSPATPISSSATWKQAIRRPNGSRSSPARTLRRLARRRPRRRTRRAFLTTAPRRISPASPRG